MAVWVIALIVVAGVAALLFLGGLAGNARERSRRGGDLAGRITGADQQLAAARALDRGWDRGAIDAAARAALAARAPGARIESLELVQVVDRPGTDEDRAKLRAVTSEGVEEVELARTGDRWHAS